MTRRRRRTEQTAASTPPRTADAAVLDAARSGDVDALTDLWIIYQPQLLGLLARHGRAVAEDVASQVWIDVDRRIDSFEGDGDAFRSWIFTIATRRAIDEARRAARQQRIAEEAASELVTVSQVRAADQYDASISAAIAMLNTLEPRVAEVVKLRVIDDLPAAEVARLTGRTETNVRVIVHRATARLQDALGDAAFGAPAFAPA